jgi:hypothetical protein
VQPRAISAGAAATGEAAAAGLQIRVEILAGAGAVTCG